MRLPSYENWTDRATERAVRRLERLFERYESLSCHDDFGRETSVEALEIEEKMWSLWNRIPVEFRPRWRPF